MNILATGGAGYIGSHTVDALVKAGHKVVILDNLCCGHKCLLSPLATFECADILDKEAVARVLKQHCIDVVFHFAGLIFVGESYNQPAKYYRVNVQGGLNVLQAMVESDVHMIIFSSSAAVYGNPAKIPIEESDPLSPINPYGSTKQFFERMLEDFAAAHGIRFVALRYFNACGADPDGKLGEMHEPETHLIPLIFDALVGKRPALDVLGNDYPTRDGTCIRDYVHVSDIADAHVLALKHLHGGGGNRVYNLGSQDGFSVLEIVQAVERVTNCKVPTRFVERRKGDPAILVASSERIRKEFGWNPYRSDIDTIIKTAWSWYQKKEKMSLQ